PDGMEVVCRYEDDRRHAIDSHGLHDGETVHPRHPNVQKDEILANLFDRLDGLGSLGTFADDRGVCVACQQIANPLACERLIVDDQDTELPPAGEGCGRTPSSSEGIRTDGLVVTALVTTGRQLCDPRALAEGRM